MNRRMRDIFIKFRRLLYAYSFTRLFKETYQQISVVCDYKLTTLLIYSKSLLSFHSVSITT